MAYNIDPPPVTVTSVADLPLSPTPLNGTEIVVLGTPEPAIAQGGAWFMGGQQVKP